LSAGINGQLRGKGIEGKVMRDYLNDPRFKGIKPFEKRVWLSSPTMHGEEMLFLKDAFDK